MGHYDGGGVVDVPDVSSLVSVGFPVYRHLLCLDQPGNVYATQSAAVKVIGKDGRDISEAGPHSYVERDSRDRFVPVIWTEESLDFG